MKSDDRQPSRRFSFVPYDEAYEAGFEDMPRRVPDISKLHSLIGYEPKVDLDDIISRVIAHTREQG